MHIDAMFLDLDYILSKLLIIVMLIVCVGDLAT